MSRGNLFRDDGTCRKVTIPGTIGELLLWYKKNVKTIDPDIASLSRKTSVDKFEYMTCIYDAGSPSSDIVVFKTVIPMYTFQTMDDIVYSYDNDLATMGELVFRLRKFGDKIM